MKRLFLILAVVAMALPSCKKIEESIDALENRIEVLENETIPTIDEQIAAINVSLDALDATDNALKGYIDGLQATADNLQGQINATNTKIDEVKTALQNEISTAKAEVLAELEALETELKNELSQINATIETLKAKDTELDQKIADLRTYVDTELGKTTDWVKATFATLEQYNAIVAEVTAIKAQIEAINESIADLETKLTTKINEDIANAVSTLNSTIQQKVSEITTAYTEAVKAAKDEITKAYTAAIATAISDLETSLKSWVSEQLENYYTIAEVEAKISALENAMTEGDEALQEELNALKSQLEVAKAELTEAYKKAIEEAINTNNGVINGKIAEEVAKINSRIDSEVATINSKIAAIESRLDNVEAQVKDLLARIQSVSYIPEYADGKATVKYAGTKELSEITLDFEVSPKDAVTQLANVWQEALSLKAVYTQTRAVSFVDMQIVGFETDTSNGVISVIASGKDLSAEFFAGTQEASVRLSISDGNNSVTSDYIPMVTKEITDEIWYTSTDNEVVVPCADDVFGVKIVSNTCKYGLGVITFDAPLVSIGNDAFCDCTSLTSITIPDSVTSIGDSAFRGCSSLTSITIPDSVISIGDAAFGGCTSLMGFYGKYASEDNSCLVIDGVLKSVALAGLTKYTIPDGITSIGGSVFERCTSLESVTISASVTEIGDSAFKSCSNLKSVACKPTTPPTLGDNVFSENAVGRKLYVLDYDALDSYNTTWSEYASDIEFAGIIYTATEKVEPLSWAVKNTPFDSEVMSNEFDPNTGIGVLSFDELIYEIPGYTFCQKSALTHVTLPSTITTIHRQVFDRTSISEIVIPDSVTSLGEHTLSCESLTSVTLSQNLKTIEGYCFSGCRNLESISLPQTLTNIGEHAFSFCPLLNNVVLPNLVTAIGTECFRGCGSLTNITLNEGLEIIGQSVFEGVPFEEITIPSTVTFIGNTAFHNNSNLLRVYCKPTIPPTSLKYGSAFMSYNENLVIYVPEASVDYYKNCEGDDTRKHWAYVEDRIQGYPF